jgi:uncharacterized protein YjbI with pentapeptide repeats
LKPVLASVFAVGLAVAFAIFVVVAYRHGWQWTGLPATRGVGGSTDERPAKTLWDWLQLLGIPVALASLAFLLNEAQSRREQRHEDQRAAQQRKVEDQRAMQQRTSAVDAERENTLRTYLAQMSDLMLARRLLRSKPGADVREVARTATLTAVRRLDGPRRGLVGQFLAEARLLDNEKQGGMAVDLSRADLAHAGLYQAVLSGADLSRADLTGADLRRAFLVNANLSGARLFGAHLQGALLGQADLLRANLSGAHLYQAHLHGADLRGALLFGAHLFGAHLRGANLRDAILVGANLRGADFSGANLRGAYLVNADVSGAFLRGATLAGAYLTGADLSGGHNVDMTGSLGDPAHAP